MLEATSASTNVVERTGDFRLTGPLALTHIRGPLSPKTWSGTSLNLADGLKAAGCDVRGIDSGLHGKSQKLMYAGLSLLSGYGPIYIRTRAARMASARIVMQRARESGSERVLHCGTLDLPLPKDLVGDGVKHYMYTDSTWDMWYKDVRFRFLTKRLIKHAEDMDREAYSQLEHIFLTSEFARDRFIERYGVPASKISVVGTGRGRDIKAFSGEKSYDNGLILFIAKHRWVEKGGPLLLEGFKLARQQRPNLKLVVLGNDEVKQMVAGGLGGPGVEVLGHIPFEQLQDLFNTASLYAMPALMEPWGLVYLEALACRTPILGLNRMAFPELSGHGRFGFAVNDATPQAVAAGLVEAMSDPARLDRMGREGQAFVAERFSWEMVGRRVVEKIYG